MRWKKKVAGKQCTMGDKFTVADAYLFTVLRWANMLKIDLGKWPNIRNFVARVAARPAVQETMKAQRLLKQPFGREALHKFHDARCARYEDC